MARHTTRFGSSPSGAAMPARARAHRARPARRRRRLYQFERLEDRFLMAGDAAGTFQATSAQYDVYSVWSDTGEVVLNVLENDSGEELQIIESGSPWFGELRIADDARSLIFKPQPENSGQTWFHYTVRGADHRQKTIFVELNVRPRYQAQMDYLQVDLNSQENRLDVLADDSANMAGIDPQIVGIESQDAGGSFTVDDDGKSLIFTPDDGFQGRVNASYKIRIGPGENDVITAHVSVEVVRPFLAVDDWFVVDPAEGPATLTLLANDPVLIFHTHVHGQNRQLRIVAATADSGQAEVSADGKQVLYAAAPGFTGQAQITYEIEDEFGNRDTAMATVLVSGEPAATIDTYHRAEWEVQLLQMAATQHGRLFGAPATPTEFVAYYPYVICYDDVDMPWQWTKGSPLTDSSQTNTQVAGVDEADLMETDGRYIYTISNGKLAIIDAGDPASLRLVSVAQLSGRATAMFLDGDRLTIIGESELRPTFGYWNERTTVAVIDVSDPAAPEVVRQIELDGRLVASRSIDGQVHLVLNQPITVPVPDQIEIAHAHGSKSLRYETWEEYTVRIRATGTVAALPQFESRNALGELVASGALTSPGEIIKSLSLTGDTLASIVTIDSHSDAPDPVGGATWRDQKLDAEAVYMNGESLYVWSTEGQFSSAESTTIRKFDLRDRANIQLVAIGEVAGRTLNQFSFDERDGLLRVVTNSPTRLRGRLTGEVNDLYVLEQNGAELVVVGQVSDFADGESVRSVRFDGDRALVVTFPDPIFNPNVIPVDPLFIIDLSDPHAPTIKREVDVPGFSTYLEMLDDERLLGFGADIDPVMGASGGVLLSLFRAEGLDEPEILDQFRFDVPGHEWSIASADHHAIAYYPELQVVTVPIQWVDPETAGSANARSYHELWVLRINPETNKFELVTRVAHDTPAFRSIRIGETLFSLSGDTLTAHSLTEPGGEIDRLYFGTLPRDDLYRHAEDSGPWTLDVLANDRTTEAGDSPTLASVTQPVAGYYNWYFVGGGVAEPAAAIGSVEIAEDGKSVIFTPHADFFGTAVFTYTVFDAIRGEQTATVSVVVTPVADAPDAVNDEFTVELGAASISLDVLANDVNPDSRPLTFSPWIYSLAADDAVDGIRAFQVPLTNVLVDSLALRDTDVWYPTTAYSPLKISAVGIGDHGGKIEVDPLGERLVYTPPADFVGTETFTYTVLNVNGLTDTATVTVQVGNVPAAEEPLAEISPATATEQAEVVPELITGPASPLLTETSVPAEASLAVEPQRVVAPLAAAFDFAPAARPGAVFSSRRLTFSEANLRSFRQDDSLNLAYLSAMRGERPESPTERAFANFAPSPDADGSTADFDLESIGELLTVSAAAST